MFATPPQTFARLRRMTRGIALGWLIALLIACAAPAAAAPVATPSPAATATSAYASVKPDQQASIIAATQGRLPTYRIETTLDPSNPLQPRIEGKVHLDYVNTTGTPLTTLPFRLYANNPKANAGSMRLATAAVAGQAVAPVLSVADTVATLPLGTTLAPGASLAIDLTYVATVPVDSSSDYGIFSVDKLSGTWALAFWYPVVAGWDPAHGFELDPVSRNGDPIFSTTAFYDVTIRAPASWRLVTSGIEIGRRIAGETQITRFSAGPVRDFNIVADNDFGNVRVEVDGTRIVSWFQPGREGIANAAAKNAAQALRLFNQLFGAYPYVELDLVPVEIYNAAGVEFPQLVYLDARYYSPDRAANEAGGQQREPPDDFNFTIAHEVMHQWWYGLIGNNQYLHAFMDEGLTNYISCQVYFEKEYGPVVGAKMTGSYLVGPYQRMLDRKDDRVVDQPTDAFPQRSDYDTAIYSKAALGFGAIRQAIGDDAFFAALRDYAARERFQVAQPDDLKQAFERASGKNLDALWEKWFESAHRK